MSLAYLLGKNYKRRIKEMYTKGEWTVFKDMSGLTEFPAGHHQVVGDGQKSNIAIVPIHWDNSEANARLIAAAPDMYEALKEFLTAFQVSADNYQGFEAILSPIISRMREAIAKADGGKQMICPLVNDRCPKDCPNLTVYGCKLPTLKQEKQLKDLRGMRK